MRRFHASGSRLPARTGPVAFFQHVRHRGSLALCGYLRCDASLINCGCLQRYGSLHVLGYLLAYGSTIGDRIAVSSGVEGQFLDRAAKSSTTTSMSKRSASGRRTASSAAHSATARTDLGAKRPSISRREKRACPKRYMPRRLAFVCTTMRSCPSKLTRSDRDAIRWPPSTTMTASISRCPTPGRAARRGTHRTGSHSPAPSSDGSLVSQAYSSHRPPFPAGRQYRCNDGQLLWR